MNVIDLTLPFDRNTPVFPGNPEISISPAATIEKNGCSVLALSLSSHTGTHVDAPSHFIKTGNKLSDFSPAHWVGSATALDCRGQSEIVLSDSDLSHIKSGDIVLLHTAHSDRYRAPAYFDSYPVVSEETARKLAGKNVRMVGIDLPSPDRDPWAIHRILLQKNICILENLTNLRSLVGRRFMCVVSPLPITEGDGAPCRVFALLD